MILQYLSKVDDKTIETIIDNVDTVHVSDEKISVMYSKSEGKYTVDYPKGKTQIYNMWLLNDNFKPLKELTNNLRP